MLVVNFLCFCISSKRRNKKKIRRILDDAELGEETRRKIAIEKVPFFRFIRAVVSFSGYQIIYFFLNSCRNAKND